MATRTTRKAPPREELPALEMTMFGRRWQARDWWIPVYCWTIVMIVAAVVNRLQMAGKIPVGGTGFLLGCAAVTLVGMLCGMSVGGTAVMTRRVTYWCIGTPAAGGAWVWYTSITGMTSGLAPWIAFGILGLLCTFTYRNVRDFQRDHELALIFAQEQEAEQEQIRELSEKLAVAQTSAPDADAEKWEAWTDAARLPGMIFWGRHPLKNGSGILLHYELPDDGSVSYEMVAQAANKLELQLFKKHRDMFDGGSVHPGCVRVQRATDAHGRPCVGEVFITIDVVDILAKTLRMPTGDEDYTEISIMEAFPVGSFSDGTPIYLTIHEIHTLIIGQTQHGKSNLLHVMIRQLARCTDAVLWGLDFKGGDTLRLWMNPFMRGEIDQNTGKPLAQCIFDWVCVNDHIEAERMLLSALEAANGRPAIVGGGGWVPSKTRPAIIVMADEVSMIVGTGSGRGGRSAFHVGTDVLAGLLADMFKLGTGQGVYGITASQRGTVDSVGSGTAKSQQKGRILLPVTEGASDVLQGADPEAIRLAKNLTHKGSVVIEGFGNTVAKVGKIWLAGHKAEIQNRIRHEVMRLTYLRRDVKLDAETAALIEQFGYAGRPGGPAPDPDRIAWYFGQKPKRQLLTWDHQYVPGSNEPVKIAAYAAATAASASTSGSTADALGLGDVRSVLAERQQAQPAAPATVTSLVGRQRAGSAAGFNPAWLERHRDRIADPAPAAPATGPDPVEPPVQTPEAVATTEPAAPAAYAPPPPPPEPAAPLDPMDIARMLAPRGQAPTLENSSLLMIHLVNMSGSSGTNGAGIYRQLMELGCAPDRGTVYQWLTKLVANTVRNGDASKKVVQDGKLFFTEVNRPMPSRMAS